MSERIKKPKLPEENREIKDYGKAKIIKGDVGDDENTITIDGEKHTIINYSDRTHLAVPSWMTEEAESAEEAFVKAAAWNDVYRSLEGDDSDDAKLARESIEDHTYGMTGPDGEEMGDVNPIITDTAHKWKKKWEDDGELEEILGDIKELHTSIKQKRKDLRISVSKKAKSFKIKKNKEKLDEYLTCCMDGSRQRVVSRHVTEDWQETTDYSEEGETEITIPLMVGDPQLEDEIVDKWFPSTTEEVTNRPKDENGEDLPSICDILKIPEERADEAVELSKQTARRIIRRTMNEERGSELYDGPKRIEMMDAEAKKYLEKMKEEGIGETAKFHYSGNPILMKNIREKIKEMGYIIPPKQEEKYRKKDGQVKIELLAYEKGHPIQKFQIASNPSGSEIDIYVTRFDEKEDQERVKKIIPLINKKWDEKREITKDEYEKYKKQGFREKKKGW